MGRCSGSAEQRVPCSRCGLELSRMSVASEMAGLNSSAAVRPAAFASSSTDCCSCVNHQNNTFENPECCIHGDSPGSSANTEASCTKKLKPDTLIALANFGGCTNPVGC